MTDNLQYAKIPKRRNNMYCKNCGKELANDAIMCPNCGSPTGVSPQSAKKLPAQQSAQSGSIPFVAFIVSVLALFLAPFVCAVFFVCYNVYVIIFVFIALILLAVSGFILALYAISGVKSQQGRTRVFSIIGIVFTSVVLLLLVVMLCVFIFI